MINIDETDSKILRALIKDARSKLVDIANECGISSTAVKNRIKRLKKSGLIVRAALNINMTCFDYPYPILIGVNVEDDQEHNITKLIRKNIKVAGIDHTIGKYNLCLFVFAKTVNELDKLKYLIRKQKGVKNIEINIWNKIHMNYTNINLQNKGV
jgi:Lrp/AsnC family transcriptional regulator for asnA, asnC and gidA